MTFVNVGRFGVKPGRRDRLIEILTRPIGELHDHGCLRYDIGVNDDDPDAVFVSEVWESSSAHAAWLELESVRAGISEAMPLLSGEVGGYRFEVVGSPLRS